MSNGVERISSRRFSNIKVYEWLTFFDYSKLSENKMLKLNWIFNGMSGECRVCIQCNGNWTNWSFVKTVLLSKFVLSCKNDQRLWESLQDVFYIQLHESMSFFLSDDHPWGKNDERKANNQQLKDECLSYQK